MGCSSSGGLPGAAAAGRPVRWAPLWGCRQQGAAAASLHGCLGSRGPSSRGMSAWPRMAMPGLGAPQQLQQRQQRAVAAVRMQQRGMLYCRSGRECDIAAYDVSVGCFCTHSVRTDCLHILGMHIGLHLSAHVQVRVRLWVCVRCLQWGRSVQVHIFLGFGQEFVPSILGWVRLPTEVRTPGASGWQMPTKPCLLRAMVERNVGQEWWLKGRVCSRRCWGRVSTQSRCSFLAIVLGFPLSPGVAPPCGMGYAFV